MFPANNSAVHYCCCIQHVQYVEGLCFRPSCAWNKLSLKNIPCVLLFLVQLPGSAFVRLQTQKRSWVQSLIYAGLHWTLNWLLHQSARVNPYLYWNEWIIMNEFTLWNGFAEYNHLYSHISCFVLHSQSSTPVPWPLHCMFCPVI